MKTLLTFAAVAAIAGTASAATLVGQTLTQNGTPNGAAIVFGQNNTGTTDFGQILAFDVSADSGTQFSFSFDTGAVAIANGENRELATNPEISFLGFNNTGSLDATTVGNLSVVSTDTQTFSAAGDTVTSTGSLTLDGTNNFAYFLVQDTVLPNGDPTPAGAQTNLTNAALTITGSAVPEPSSTVLLGLGGLALLARRRR